MNYLHRSIIAAALVTCCACPDAYAEANDTCQDLVKACFASALDQRDDCIQTVAANSLCASAQLGALVSKRAQFGDTRLVSEDQGPAFLGPQLIDRRCVSNFDTAWSAALVKGPLSPEKISSLSKALEECATSEPKALPRP